MSNHKPSDPRTQKPARDAIAERANQLALDLMAFANALEAAEGREQAERRAEDHFRVEDYDAP